MSLLLLLHLPAAFGLAALHGTWIAAFLVGGGVSLTAYLLAQRSPGAFSTWARTMAPTAAVISSALVNSKGKR